MTQYLRGLGYVINRKRVQRLMQKLGLAGMTPDPNTSKPHQNQMLQLLSDPAKAVSFAKVVFDLLKLAG